MSAVVISIPPLVSGVYLVKRGGRVVYIGQALNIWNRLRGHPLIEPGDEVEFQAALPDELNARERAAIERHRPELNIAGISRPYSGRVQQKGYRVNGKLRGTLAEALHHEANARGGYVSATALRRLGILGGSYRNDPLIRATFLEPDLERANCMFWSVGRILDHVATKEATNAMAS
jgi:hypothetical protein